jgi:ATP synthase F1 complex assembly factor 2
VEGQLFNRQSAGTVEKLSKVIAKYDSWRLAGFERAVMASKSYLIGIGLAEGRLTADQAAMAAHVEVQSQIDRWGEVEDSGCQLVQCLHPFSDSYILQLTM